MNAATGPQATAPADPVQHPVRPTDRHQLRGGAGQHEAEAAGVHVVGANCHCVA